MYKKAPQIKHTAVVGSLIVAAASQVPLVSSAAVAYPYVSGPVTITSCSVEENPRGRTVGPNGLHIQYYVNKSSRRLTSVTFHVRYGTKSVNLTDAGTFYEEQPIKLQFYLFGGLPWKGPTPAECRVLTAAFAAKISSPDATETPAAAPVESAIPAASPEATGSAPAPVPSSS